MAAVVLHNKRADQYLPLELRLQWKKKIEGPS